jgi:hypothetical protein
MERGYASKQAEMGIENDKPQMIIREDPSVHNSH